MEARELSLDLTNKNLSMKRASKHVHKPGYKFPVEKRIEVVTKWLALGNMRLVSELCGVSYQLCRMWKMEPWWQELVDEIKISRSAQLDSKLSKIVDKSLDIISDRLENGDVIFNNKTGQVMRKEVSIKDANKVATDLMQRQVIIQKEEQSLTSQQQTVAIGDQLKLLAMEFAKFNRKNTGPIEDAVIIEEIPHALHEERKARLQEGSSEVYFQARSEEKEGGTEQSETNDGAGRESS